MHLVHSPRMRIADRASSASGRSDICRRQKRPVDSGGGGLTPSRSSLGAPLHAVPKTVTAHYFPSFGGGSGALVVGLTPPPSLISCAS